MKPVLAIIIRWIGFEASPTPYRVGREYKADFKASTDLLKINSLKKYEASHKVTSHTNSYGFTCLGEPVNVEAMCT